MPDYPDFETPQAHADSIFGTGVPLYSKAVNVVNDQARVIGAGATVTIANAVAVAQIGYEISVVALANAGSAAPFCQVELIWTDSVTGTTVGDEQWTLWAASSGGGSSSRGTGPTKGDRLTIKVTNGDGANTMTVTTILNANSRVYLTDDWRQTSLNSIPTFTNPLRDQQGNILAGFNANINAGASQIRTIPLYAGKVTVAARCLGASGGTIQVQQLDPQVNVPYLLYGNIPVNPLTANFEISLPRAVCDFSITNTSGIADTFQALIVVSGYRS
jgi:hypothetical protein